MLYRNEDFLENLNDLGVSYYSYTFFKEKLPILSFSSSPEWLSIYKKNYEPLPPVQKYILSSKLDVLLWDITEVDTEAKKFIKQRNDVVESNSNLTLFFRENSFLTAVTFGTKHGKSHLFNLLNKHAEITDDIKKQMRFLIASNAS